MGTSKPNNGPGDKTPLLPDWAQPDDPPPPPDDENPPPDEIPPDEEPEPPDDPPDPDEEPEIPGGHVNPQGPPDPPPTPTHWQTAKRNMKNFVVSGDAADLRRTGRSYVKAKGGAQRAAANAKQGRIITGRILNFLSDVVNNGVEAALNNIGLQDIQGQSVESILAAIIDILAPDGASLEEAVSRRTEEAVFSEIFEEYAVDENGIDELENMGAEGVERTFVLTVSEYIYQLWLVELGKRIDDGAIDASEAVQLERMVKAYVNNAVELDLQGRDILTTDWTATESQGIINDVYAQAYEFLEDAQ